MTHRKPTCARHGPSPASRGAAMLLVLLALVLAAVLAMTFLARQSPNTAIAGNVQRHATARMIAESGLTSTVEYIRRSDGWRENHLPGYWSPAESLYGGSFRVMFEDEDGDLTDDPDDSVMVSVLADYDGVTHRVSAEVDPAVPPAAHALLLVVDDPAALDAGDQARIKRVQGWDYDVTLIDDSASQATFDSQLAMSDVVWVSPSARSGTLSTKLLHATVGVVTSLRGQWQALGLVGSAPSVTSDARLDVVDTSHYITQPFVTGEMFVFDADQPMLETSAAVAPGARVIGRSSGGGAALATIDAGGEMISGDNAVGRRAFLPWAGDNSLDFTALNSSGLTLLRRSLEWAAAPPEGPPALAHWRLDETGGNTAFDSNGTHHGTVFGGAPWVLGQIIGALEPDGVEDYVRVLSHDDFKVTDALTISAWVKPTSFGSGDDVNVILRKGEGNPNNWQFSLKNGRPTLFLDDYDNYGIRGNTVLPLNTWSHVAATWDGSVARILVNGQPDNGNGRSRTGTIGTDDRPIFIGGRAGSAGYDRFDGRIDDVRFYNRALSPAEVLVMYEEGVADSVTPRLLARYLFEEVKPAPAVVGRWKLDEAGNDGGGIAAGDSFQVRGKARIDSYNSSDGAYTLGKAGADALASTNSTWRDRFYMDVSASLWGHAFCGAGGSPGYVIEAHEGSISGKRAAQRTNVSFSDYSSPGGVTGDDHTITSAVTWDDDQIFDDLNLGSGAVVKVDGAVTVIVNDDLNMGGDAQVILGSGSSLTVYVADDVNLSDNAKFNPDTTAASAVRFFAFGNGALVNIEGNATFCGVMTADGDTLIQDAAQFFGSLMVRDDLTVRDEAQVHLDIDLASLGVADSPAIDTTRRNTGRYRGGALGGYPGANASTGDAVLLDGTNDFIEIPHHDAYLLNSGTVAMWFRTDDASLDQGLFTKDASGYGDGGHLNVSVKGGVIRAALSDTGAEHVLTSAPIADDRWYHVALSFGPAGLRLYVNGVLTDQDDYVGGLGTTSGGTGNTEPILVGADTAGSSAGSIDGWTNPLRGRIDDLRIYDDQVDANQADQMRLGLELSASTLPGWVVEDSAGFGGALHLVIPDTGAIAWAADGGLTLSEPVTIRSMLPARKIADAVADTGQFTVEARFAPADDQQDGPARIVGVSSDKTARNFTLGQDRRRHSLRLRTQDTGGNGTPDLQSEAVMEDDTVEHVIFSYDGAYVYIYRNGSLETTLPRTGGLANWDDTMDVVVGAEAEGSYPWLGRLERIAIYDRALNARQASNVFQGLPPGRGVATTYEVDWREQE